MASFLFRYLERGRRSDLVVAVLMLAVTASSHLLTSLLLVPLLIATTSATAFMVTRLDTRVFLRRLLSFGVPSLLLAMMVVYPLWQFLIEAEVQTQIPHGSRENLFVDVDNFVLFFRTPYLVFLPAILISVVAAKRHRFLIPMLVQAFFLFLMGLGGSTPLPGLLFGNWSDWLTYDRFSLWAGISFLPLWGALLLVPQSIGGVRLIVAGIVILALMGSITYVILEPTHHPSDVNLDPIQEFLSREEASQFRYITLGLGEARMQRLSTLTDGRTLDGGYYTARELPVLRKSGIPALDAAKHFDNGKETLASILDDAPVYHLKWVISSEAVFDELLEEKGFVNKWSAQNTGDTRLGEVIIWERGDILPLSGVEEGEAGFGNYVSGVAPMTVFLIVILIFLQKATSRVSGVSAWIPKPAFVQSRRTNVGY